MYYLAKILELLGMFILGVSFVINFPELINWNFFIVGIAFFTMGFMIEKFVLK
jgi:hypothetical protein|tara:strand:- start:945 stop:1103 length:159 start_codon:yes stop_codon:yes gene_type:complete